MKENKEIVLVFYVKGSGKNPYRVAFWKEENSRNIHSGCGCPAGRRMQYCKHRFQLIEGDLTNLDNSTEDAKEKLEVLYNWIEDSDIGDFFEDFIKAKTGEKVSKIVNGMKFHKSVVTGTYFDEFMQKEVNEYNRVYLNDEELTEKYGITHKELSLEEFLKLIESNIIVVGSRKRSYLFDENRNYYGTYNGKKKEFEGYGLVHLGIHRYTKSQHLIDCLEYYKTVNIKSMNEKMKEIMK